MKRDNIHYFENSYLSHMGRVVYRNIFFFLKICNIREAKEYKQIFSFV